MNKDTADVRGPIATCMIASIFGVSIDASAGAIYDVDNEYRLASRSALVIGVGDLEDDNGFSPLRNPRNDAREVANALKAVGFRVVNLSESLDPQKMTRQNIKKAIYDFAELLHS